MDKIRKILEARRLERNIDYKEISKVLGYNHAYYQQFIHRGIPRELKERDLRKVADYLEIDPNVLGISGPEQNVKAGETVREIDSKAGAGGGGTFDLVNAPNEFGDQISSEVIKDYWRIPPSFLRGELGLEPSSALMIEINGDSGYDPNNPHAPGSIFPGDRVIVDALDTRPTPPGPFLVYDGDGFVVKLCEPVRGSDPPAIRLASRNPTYTPYNITLDDGHSIVGRVVGRFTRM